MKRIRRTMILVLSAFLTALIIFLPADTAQAATEASEVSVVDDFTDGYDVFDLNDPYSVAGPVSYTVPEDGATFFIYAGKETCSNSQYLLSQLDQSMLWGDDRFHFILLLSMEDYVTAQAYIDKYLGVDQDALDIYYDAVYLGSTFYDRMIRNTAPYSMGTPGIFMVEEDGPAAIRTFTACANFVARPSIFEEMYALVHPDSEIAYRMTNMSGDVLCTYQQSSARSMLDMINSFRMSGDAWWWSEDDSEKVYMSPQSELTYDYELEALAMQRAAELALSFSHNRPDNSVKLSMGENIAIGQETAREVFTDWQEASCDYEGQGHRRNMLNSDYQAIGIAHAVIDGVDYWVQEFDYDVSGSQGTIVSSTPRRVTVQFSEYFYERYKSTHDFDSSFEDMKVGDSQYLPDSYLVFDPMENGNVQTKVYLEGTWTSEDTSIAVIEDDQVKAVGPGTVMLYKELDVPEVFNSATYGISCRIICNKHSWNKGETVFAAKCTSKGQKAYTCSVCGEIKLEDIPAKGHSWDAGKVTKKPTDSADGVRTYTCTTCGKTKTEAIPRKEVAVTGLSLDQSEATLVIGETLTLKATVKPANVSNKTLTWKSSNSKTASVSQQGLVTARAAGSAVITVSSANGKKATFNLTVKEERCERLYGTGRYDTMASIVSEGFTKTGGTVIVATGSGFKDALAAAGLAGLYDAPVILTDGNNLSAQAKAELQRLKPVRVYVAGGEAAVSKKVYNQIKTAVKSSCKEKNMERLYGPTSSATSAALALEGKGQWSETAIIATNKSFKDALSAAPLSFAGHMPILLADNGKSLSQTVIDALKSCGIKNVIIVGGEAAVSPNVVKQLNNNRIKLKERLAGSNGVETSRRIAEYGLKTGLSMDKIGVATSQNFPDALAGAALCGHNGSVLVLADDKALYNTEFVALHKDEINTIYIFGGKFAVGENTANLLEEAVSK